MQTVEQNKYGPVKAGKAVRWALADYSGKDLWERLYRVVVRVAAGRGGRGMAVAPVGTLQGAAFEGRNFGILAFALQCISVGLYLFLIYSVHWDAYCRLEGPHHGPLPQAAKTLVPPFGSYVAGG